MPSAHAHAPAPALSAKAPDELLAEFEADPAGGEAAFGEVVRRYAGMVFATCLRVTKDAHDAEDATQATFLTLAVQCKTGKPVRRLTPWLQQVAKRAALDLRRSRRRRETHEHRHSQMAAHSNGHVNGEPAANHAGGPAGGAHGAGGAEGFNSGRLSDEHDAEKVNKVLAEEVAKLPAKYRMPLVSLYFGGLSRQEVAKELRCTPAALSVRVHRGRQMLGKRLTARGVVIGLLGQGPGGAGRGRVGRALSLGGLVAGGVGDALREAMVARTAEAVAKATLGKNLAASVSANVLSLVRTAAGASAGAGALLAKLKVPVMLVLLLAGATAGAAGGSARVRETLREWTGELQLAPVVRRVMQMFRSPFRPPQFSSATGPGARGIQKTNGAAPVGGAGRAPALPLTALPAQRAATPPTLPPLAVGAPRSTPSREASRVVSPALASSEPAPSGGVATGNLPPTPPAPASAARAVVVAAPANGAAGHGGDRFAAAPRAAATPPPPVGEGDFSLDPGGGSLSVGAEPGSRGSFALSGGSFWAAMQDIGREGAGVLSQSGGADNWGSELHLGAGAGGSGTYNLSDGTFIIAPPAGPGATGGRGVYVGGAGHGFLNLGDAHTGGAMFSPDWSGGGRPVTPVGDNVPTPAPGAPSDFVVRGDPAGSGTVRGWGGAIGNGGVFVNNGRVIADGYGKDRALIFLGYGSVTNTIDNSPAGGANGWFARRGGRLFLPKIATAAGTNTYTWGEDAADPTIDLVNSVRFTLHDARGPGKVDVSLLDKARADVPVLPTGHTFIGVWSMDTGVTRPDGGVDLVVRYDDGLARQLGLNENVLKLWQYDDGSWRRINDGSFARDVQNNILSGHADPTLTFFAVSAPEPSAAAMALFAGGALLLRRRR